MGMRVLTYGYDFAQHIVEAMRNTRHRHVPTIDKNTQK